MSDIQSKIGMGGLRISQSKVYESQKVHASADVPKVSLQHYISRMAESKKALWSASPWREQVEFNTLILDKYLVLFVTEKLHNCQFKMLVKYCISRYQSVPSVALGWLEL